MVSRSVTDDGVLPAFDRPPVAEVAFSVQFAPIAGLTVAHLGAWWSAGERERYPVLGYRPAMTPVAEQFGSPAGMLTFQILTTATLPAIALHSDDGHELIQVQVDRFTRNWAERGGEYPHYEALRPRFEADFVNFTSFLESERLPPPLLSQCELTYVNPVQAEGWKRHGELDRVLAPWSGATTDGWLPEPEDVQVLVRYRIERDGRPVGRLLANVQAAYDAQAPIQLITMTARGSPLGGGNLAAALAFFDLAHEWIIHGFADLTTSDMHTRWERRQ